MRPTVILIALLLASVLTFVTQVQGIAPYSLSINPSTTSLGNSNGQSRFGQYICPIQLDFDFVDRVERHRRNQRWRCLQCCCESDIADKHSERCDRPVHGNCYDECCCVPTNFRDNCPKGGGIDNHRYRDELFGGGERCHGNCGHSFERPTYSPRS